MRFLPLAAACACCAAAFVSSHLRADEVDELIVTATRTRVPAADVLAPIIVIDRTEIERSGALDLAELLRFHAGVEIARTGGPGATTTVFMRGTESNHTLVLVDGVEINPGTIGGAGVQNIAPDAIERIEIVKGPRSSLYGSEAIGGVINVITRAPTGISAEVGVARYDQRELHASAGFDGERGSFGAYVDTLSTDGFPPRVENDIERGYDSVNAGLRGRIDIGGTRLTARHWQTSGNSEYLDFLLAPVDQDFATRATALELEASPGARWDTTVRLSHVLDEIEQQQSPDFVRTKRDALDWQHTIRANDRHQVVAGIQVSDEKTSGENFGLVLDDGDGDGRVDTDVYEVYAADNFSAGDHAVMAAVRHTDHSTFGTHDTWNVEYGYDFPRTRVTAAAGTGFRAPDSTDRFGFGGNPDLKPERSRNLEVGVRRRIGAYHEIGLQVFDDEIDDLIDFVLVDPDTFEFQARNVASARIRGVEATYSFALDPWDVRVAANVQDPEDETTGARLLRRARTSLTAGVARAFGPHEIGLDVLWSGDREDFGFEAPVPLGSYTLANLSGTLRLGDHWTLRGNIENLLDEDYQLADGYRTPGRAFHLRVGYTVR
jgi:vitamin B12 transporter